MIAASESTIDWNIPAIPIPIPDIEPNKRTLANVIN